MTVEVSMISIITWGWGGRALSKTAHERRDSFKKRPLETRGEGGAAVK